MKLDGTDKITPTPFDAHEKVVRGPHTHSAASGYEATEYEHQEFPKVLKHDEESGEPSVVAKDAKHEEELREEHGL